MFLPLGPHGCRYAAGDEEAFVPRVHGSGDGARQREDYRCDAEAGVQTAPAAPVKRTRIIPGEHVDPEDADESDEPDDEELAGIEAGLADVAAGRTRPLEDIRRELEGETKMANEELCPCGRPAHHRGMHRGQKAGAALRTSAVSASTNGHKRMAISCMGGGEIDLTEPYYKAVEQRDRLNKFIESVERLVSLDKEA